MESALKRKRRNTDLSDRKRTKTSSSSPTNSDNDDDDREWAVRSIIEERIAKRGELALYNNGTVTYTSKRGELWYLIDWEDDPDTGEAFEASWAPAFNVLDHESQSSESQGSSEYLNTTKRQIERTRKQRNRCVIESSEPSIPSSIQSTPAARAHRQSPLNIESRKPLSGESFQRLSLSQQELELSYLSPTSAKSASSTWPHETFVHGLPSYHSTGVVLESESEEEVDDNPSASYVPTTQSNYTASSSSLPHDFNTHEELDVSTSLGASSPYSSAISIPETESEYIALSESDLHCQTIEESAVQTQTEDRQEVPDTFETEDLFSRSATEEPLAQVQPLNQEQALTAFQATFCGPTDIFADYLDSLQQTTLLDSTPELSQHNSRVDESAARTRDWLTQSLPEGLDISSRVDSRDIHEPAGSHSHLQTIDNLSWPQSSISYRPSSTEQHAQLLSTHSCQNSQEQHEEQPFPLVEQDSSPARPRSRHDSSQGSPKAASVTTKTSTSSAPRPPLDSLGTPETNTNPPARIELPSSCDSIAAMADFNAQNFWATVQKEASEKTTRDMSLRAISEDGTRSPSTIPGNMPMPQVATALRTVAAPTSAPGSALAPAEGSGDSGGNNVSLPDEDPFTSLPGPLKNEQPSEFMEEDSLLSDDLHLDAHEYIVPLPIEGRQANDYRETLKKREDILDHFILNPREADQNTVETALRELQAIETHVDIKWSDNDSSGRPEESDQHVVQWSYDNSVKFRFLGALLDKLRDHEVHIIIVIEKEGDKKLLQTTESFLRGKRFKFESPITTQTFNGEGSLRITILASTSSNLTRPADLIVCIDGKLHAAVVRNKKWAVATDRNYVPVIHLVVPRTIGHIERYLSTNLSTRDKLHTIAATLAQFKNREEIGRAVDITTPRAGEAATDVVKFLFPSEDSELSKWPLPGVGSIKDMVDFQSQQSQDVSEMVASAPNANASGKRPLVQGDGEANSAKRMRFTPQPQIEGSNSGEVVVETNHAAASEMSERQLYDAERKRFREVEKAFSKQQRVHESTIDHNNELKGRNKELEKKLAESLNREGILKRNLEARTTEKSDLSIRLSDLESTLLLSDDDLKVENTRLRKQLAEAKESEERANRNRASIENTHEYFKDQYRELQGENSQLQASNQAHLAREAKLQLEASGKHQENIRQHQERQDRLAAQKSTGLANQNDILRKQNKVLSTENDRLKAELEKIKATRGVGGGTRAATPVARTPRPGSRAASPAPNGRDRLSNLRNG